VQYYVGCLLDYLKAARHGFFRTDDLALLLAALEQEPPAVRDVVKSTRYYDSSVNAPTAAGRVVPRVKAVLGDGLLHFDTVFDALAWDEANPREPVESTYLDLTVGFDQVPRTKSKSSAAVKAGRKKMGRKAWRRRYKAVRRRLGHVKWAVKRRLTHAGGS
jgi:hypothetical protein